MTNVTLPPLAEGVEKASVSYWYHAVGENVNEGDELVELVTDKATFNLPAPASGVVKEILVSEGSEIKVGGVLAIIE